MSVLVRVQVTATKQIHDVEVEVRYDNKITRTMPLWEWIKSVEQRLAAVGMTLDRLEKLSEPPE